MRNWWLIRFNRNFSMLMLAGILMFINQSGKAQNQKSSFFSTLFLEAKLHQSAIMAHHTEMWSLTDGIYTSYEISLVRQTTGRTSNAFLWKYPRYGISYHYSDFGGSPWLGEAHSVMPFVSLELWKSKRFLLDFRVLFGAGYFTRIYDPADNYKNRAISSHWNASVNFQLAGKIKLTEISDFMGGLSMLHLSNGTTRSPNFGLNIPGGFAGIAFKFSGKPISFQSPDSIQYKKGKQNIRLAFGMAQKELPDFYRQKFLVFHYEMAYTRYYNHTNRYILGLEASHDQSTALIVKKAGMVNDNALKLSKYSVVAGHEWMFSNFAINFSLGFYVYNPDEKNDFFFNKIGINYFLHKNLFTSLTLKSHYAKADYLALVLGLSF